VKKIAEFIQANAHLLTARDAQALRPRKPAGMEVYNAARAACPQQGVRAAALD
jgi:hypothetical protein